jgi:phosphoribosyl-dephospho-CoA transferase
MHYKRHDLLDISISGRKRIFEELATDHAVGEELRNKYTHILLPRTDGSGFPGIVRREESFRVKGVIPVGFCGPVYLNGSRLRLATFVKPDEVVTRTTPYDLLERDSVSVHNASTRALNDVMIHARRLGITLGVWGSMALELYTGLMCTHENSDLDLLVGAAPLNVLSQFLNKVVTLESSLGLRIDVELDLPNGYGVHLKEIFGGGRTVMGKSFMDVNLFHREKLLATLPKKKSDPQNMDLASWRTHV